MNVPSPSGFYFNRKGDGGIHRSVQTSSSDVVRETGIRSESDCCVWKVSSSISPSPLDVTIGEENEERIVLFYGSLYSSGAREQVKKKLLEVGSESELKSCLRDFSGVFSGMIYLKKEDRVLAFVDQVGVKKLFYSSTVAGRTISSHLAWMSEDGGVANISPFALGSIIYCGHVFRDSLISGISQVNAGCCVDISKGRVSESEYVTYPEPRRESFKDAVARVRDAHLGFWGRMEPIVGGDITLLLSRGKDARVALKYMLDSNINPRLMSFYRKDNPLYPFVSFLRDWTDDYEAACLVKDAVGAPFQGLDIPNNYLLEHLDQIVELNHGTPLHWEFLAAAAAAAGETKYVATGFVGDVFAGKSHHYYLMHKIRSATEYGLIEFQSAGSQNIYSAVSAVLRDAGVGAPPPAEELAEGWQKQYQVCESDDLNLIFQQGIFRTRVLGRTGPTFDQMRRYVHPIYPYNDNTIIEAYRSLPEKYLRWEKAHVAQLAEDPRFSRINTTRLNVSVAHELRLLGLLGWMRRLDTLKRHGKTAKPAPSAAKDDTLRKTLSDLGLDVAVWNQLARLPRTQGFYQTVANFIAALRIQGSVAKWPAIKLHGSI